MHWHLLTKSYYGSSALWLRPIPWGYPQLRFTTSLRFASLVDLATPVPTARHLQFNAPVNPQDPIFSPSTTAAGNKLLSHYKTVVSNSRRQYCNKSFRRNPRIAGQSPVFVYPTGFHGLYPGTATSCTRIPWIPRITGKLPDFVYPAGFHGLYPGTATSCTRIPWIPQLKLRIEITGCTKLTLYQQSQKPGNSTLTQPWSRNSSTIKRSRSPYTESSILRR